MTWPRVMDEDRTLSLVLGGKSIARFGDGEFSMMFGGGYVREEPNPQLAGELYEVLTEPHPDCLVGIPTMNKKGPKYPNWSRHMERYATILSPDVSYVSAFISRPDSAPWIRTVEYARRVESLWRDRHVVVVAESGGSMLRCVRTSAKRAMHVGVRRHGAYAEIDRMEREALDSGAEVAILAVGVTATCLANRLASRGMHAVDLGSAGGFLLKMLVPKKA